MNKSAVMNDWAASGLASGRTWGDVVRRVLCVAQTADTHLTPSQAALYSVVRGAPSQHHRLVANSYTPKHPERHPTAADI